MPCTEVHGDIVKDINALRKYLDGHGGDPNLVPVYVDSVNEQFNMLFYPLCWIFDSNIADCNGEPMSGGRQVMWFCPLLCPAFYAVWFPCVRFCANETRGKNFGAQIEMFGTNWTLLHFAAAWKRDDAIKLLMERGMCVV